MRNTRSQILGSIVSSGEESKADTQRGEELVPRDSLNEAEHKPNDSGTSSELSSVEPGCDIVSSELASTPAGQTSSPDEAFEDARIGQANLEEIATKPDISEGPSVGPADPQADTSEVLFRAKPRKLFGLRRWVAFLLIGALSATLITVGVIAAIKVAERIAADREKAVNSYEAIYEEYDDTVSSYVATLSSARQAKLLYPTDAVTSEQLVKNLEVALQGVKTLSEKSDVEKLNVEDVSNEELEAEANELQKTTKEYVAAEQRLSSAYLALKENAAAKKLADEEARKAAELAAKKANAIPTTYEDLFRAGNNVAGSYFRFEGKIIQDAGSGTYRVSITKDPGYSRVFWNDPILVTIAGTTSQKLIENDIIGFVGASAGLKSYQSIFGQTIELPWVLADAADVAITGRDD